MPMSTRMLNEILKKLMENGFKASVFANTDGLILASAKGSGVNDKVIAAMVALLSDAAEKAKEEMNLDALLSMKIKYKDATILCRQIVVEKSPTSFLLASLAPPAPSDDIDKYQDQLVDWAVENCLPPLKKLVDL
jgi:predicted regulator of Ras-like GTPase activity (Roadblock/LC7/MglB family)